MTEYIEYKTEPDFEYQVKRAGFKEKAFSETFLFFSVNYNLSLHLPFAYFCMLSLQTKVDFYFVHTMLYFHHKQCM